MFVHHAWSRIAHDFQNALLLFPTLAMDRAVLTVVFMTKGAVGSALQRGVNGTAAIWAQPCSILFAFVVRGTINVPYGFERATILVNMRVLHRGIIPHKLKQKRLTSIMGAEAFCSRRCATYGAKAV